MIRQLAPVGGGLGLVIDDAILELLKIDAATRLEVSTDGTRLIIEPVRERSASVSILTQAWAPSSAAAGSIAADRPDGQAEDARRLSDPKATVEILDALTELGMSNDQFRQLHHAHNYLNTILAHRAYCARKGAGAFRFGGTNYRTALRLSRALVELKAGKAWSEAVASALEAYPK